jgi:hypothetical protein
LKVMFAPNVPASLELPPAVQEPQNIIPAATGTQEWQLMPNVITSSIIASPQSTCTTKSTLPDPSTVTSAVIPPSTTIQGDFDEGGLLRSRFNHVRAHSRMGGYDPRLDPRLQYPGGQMQRTHMNGLGAFNPHRGPRQDIPSREPFRRPSRAPGPYRSGLGTSGDGGWDMPGQHNDYHHPDVR